MSGPSARGPPAAMNSPPCKSSLASGAEAPARHPIERSLTEMRHEEQCLAPRLLLVADGIHAVTADAALALHVLLLALHVPRIPEFAGSNPEVAGVPEPRAALQEPGMLESLLDCCSHSWVWSEQCHQEVLETRTQSGCAVKVEAKLLTLAKLLAGGVRRHRTRGRIGRVHPRGQREQHDTAGVGVRNLCEVGNVRPLRLRGPVLRLPWWTQVRLRYRHLFPT
mmetsp:Transcript_15810/g.47494  ORF Transcript_15810/g.47494 Transcript_15810/m.47494 type:complete len:223 (-) Transcript_15810:729-1397(-)